MIKFSCLKILARAQVKMGKKYKKNANWPKMKFRSPIRVPEVSVSGFWGLVCIEKWSYNFDSSTRCAISGTPKMAKMGLFSAILGVPERALWVPESKLYDHFTIQTR